MKKRTKEEMREDQRKRRGVTKRDVTPEVVTPVTPVEVVTPDWFEEAIHRQKTLAESLLNKGRKPREYLKADGKPDYCRHGLLKCEICFGKDRKLIQIDSH